MALNEGWELSDNFTTVHRFKVEIGADSGEATRCLRMDGAHHGHPIVETSSTTASFDGYVAKDLAEALVAGDTARSEKIDTYLKRIGLSAASS